MIRLLVLLLLVAQKAEAQIAMAGLEGENGISLSATHLFSDLPPFGFAPIVLVVENDTPRDRQWLVKTRASRGWGARDVAITARTIEVPRSSSRTFELLAPLPGQSDRGQTDLTLTIEGFGVKTGRAYLSGSLPTYYGNARPFVALSAALEAKDRDRFSGTSSPLFAVKLDPARMPADWRALVGLDAIWLLPDDTAALTDAGHRALLDWVIQGGHLFIITGGSTAKPPYGLRVPAEKFGPYGFGEMRTLDWDGVGITEAVTQVATTIPMRDRISRERNPFHTRLAHVSVNRVLMLSFLLLFGLTVGPFNLFYLARHNRRARLLWTTPLISVLASVVMMALILLQDGVGGRGHRTVVALLMPDRSVEVVLQEQISRTGVLLSTTFPEVEETFLEPIQIQERIHGTRSYSISRGRHAGEWFTTRTVQAQRAEIVRGSRSRVEKIDGGLASTLPATVERLLCTDDQGAFWMARNVRPGDQVSLSRAEEAEVQDFFLDHLEYATPWVRALIDRQRGRPNTFFAGGAAPLAIDTLPAISWKDDAVLFVGPVEVKR